MSDKFKPGDRVRVKWAPMRGREATVVRTRVGDEGVPMVGMHLDDDEAWLPPDLLELLPPAPDVRCDRCSWCGEPDCDCPTMPAPDARDSQVGGDHYTRLSVQPWDVIEATATPEGVYWYFAGNVVKYLMRAHSKGGLEDLCKARHYLDRLITLVESGKAACGAVRAPGEGEQR